LCTVGPLTALTTSKSTTLSTDKTSSTHPSETDIFQVRTWASDRYWWFISL